MKENKSRKRAVNYKKTTEAKTEIACVARELRLPYVCNVVTENSTFDSVVRYRILYYGVYYGSVSLPSSSHHHLSTCYD
jgi:hypothetical protein